MYLRRPKKIIPVQKNYVSCLIVFLITMTAGCTTTTQRVQVSSEAAAAEAEKQREFAARDYLTNSVRLGQISYPLLQAATEYCVTDIRRGIGVNVANKYMFPKHLHSTVERLWNLEDELYVVGVSQDGPAAQAGLRFGDRIVQIDAHKVKSGKKAADHFAKLMRSQAEVAKVSLIVNRGSETIEINVVPQQICDYSIFLSHDDIVNAYADGNNVIITTGMMRFAITDQELAVVLGHEIAHNAMGHIKKKTTNFALGSIFDIAAAVYGVDTQGLFGNMAAAAFSQDFEAEADYVGLYIMSDTGMNIGQAPDFWRKMAIAHPASIKTSHGASHPPTPERFLALEKTVEEIEFKKQSGIELDPTYKRDVK